MIVAAVRKDILLLLRDKGALASLFLLPLVFMAVFGSIFGDGDGGPGSLEVALHARGDTASEVARGLAEQKSLALHLLHSEESVRTAVADGEVVAGIVLDEDFAPLLGRQGKLIIDDTSSPQQQAAVVGAVQGIMASLVFGTAAPLEVVAASKRPAPALQSGFQISVPGNAVLFGFFLALTVALSFLEDRRTGVMRRLLSSPAKRSSILLAKLVPFLVIGMVQMIFLFGAGAIFFGLDLGSSLFALFALCLVQVSCAVALGLLMATFGSTEKQVGGIGSIFLLILGLLGGAMVPRMVMPEAMKTIGLATPQAWMLDGYSEVLISQGGFGAVAIQLAAVMGFATIFALLGLMRFRFDGP